MSHVCDSCGSTVLDEPKLQKYVVNIEVTLFAADEDSAVRWANGIIPFAAKIIGIRARRCTPSAVSPTDAPQLTGEAK